MTFFSLISIFFTFTAFFNFPLIQSQQPYVGKGTTDCTNPHNSTSGLGYFCNGLNQTCQSYLTFRSYPPYTTVSTISTLFNSDPSQISQLNSVSNSATFETNKLVLVPINCFCSGQYYQENITYAIEHGDTFFLVANNTFQGLSTCQTVQSQNNNLTTTNLNTGTRIVVPVRCACPTKEQIDLGFNYLLSYLIKPGDFVSSISQRFGADVGRTLEANELSETSTVYPYTTLLVPLKTPPTSSQTIVPTTAPPPPIQSPPNTSSGKSSNRAWVYVFVGALGGGAFVLIIGIVIYCIFFQKRKKQGKTSTNFSERFFSSFEKPLPKKVEEESSEDVLESISSIAQTLSVYNFKELQNATDNFSRASLIKGSVYRGKVNGNFAAIKKMNGDVSKEINLLNKINHSSLICLYGVCFNDGHWYLIYEYAPNGPLSDWIHSNNRSGRFLNWTQRIQIALDVATGLNYLHSFSIPPHVHKDIKSDNILLDGDFRAKIAKFGLARSAESKEGEFSLTRHIVGTRGYMAPEYLENGLVSTKLDVYAFGVLVLELISGKEVSELYREENLKLSEVLDGVVGEEERSKSLSNLMDPSLQGKYPLELVVFVLSLVRSCLKKDPSSRPSMREIVQSFSRTLSSSMTWETSNNISV